MTEGIPTQIGRYQIQTELGRGGFGRVYRAFDPTVGRLVAIKVLTEGGEDVLSRFRNEATVAGNLHHENIVTVYEYGAHEGQAFLVMEYLEGEDLHQVISSQKPLSLIEKCNIMTQVAQGLYHAHQHGVVHRDVKPANIMVLRDGTVKLMDFGIARVIRDTKATRLTRQGFVLGTLLYMAPEQFAGSDIDALCDSFAYGLIFYELLTGKHPFEAADARALMYKISFEDPPPLLNLVPDCPEALERVVNRILHKDRELRYQSLQEVIFDIQPVLIELRQSQAAHQLIEAQRLYEQGELEPAQAAVLEVLSLDPSNRIARTLRETVQRQIQQRTLRPKIEAFLKTGDEQLAARRFSDAIQSFDSALRLDRGNSQIELRLEQARALMEAARKISVLLAESRRAFEVHDFAAAQAAAAKALNLDPQSTEADAFLKKIAAAIEKRAQKERIDEAANRVDKLVAQHSYDEALQVLAAMGADAQVEEVVALVRLVRAEKAAYERTLRLQEQTSIVNGLLRGERFEEAVRLVEELQKEFPESRELSNCHLYAKRELAAQQRAKTVQQAVANASALVEAKKFTEASAGVEATLSQYTGEASLVRMRESIAAAKAEWERRQALDSVLRQAAGLRSQRRFAEAIQSVTAAARFYNAAAEVADLLRELQRELELQKRAEAVQSACAEAQVLLDRQQPDAAIQTVERAMAQYPGEAQLEAMLSRARDSKQAIEKARAVTEMVRQADGLLQKGNFAGALDLLSRGLTQWPGEPALLERQKASLAAKASWEREQAILELIRKANALAAQSQFVEALELTEQSLGQYPEEPSLLRLKRLLEADWQEHERRESIRKAVEQANSLISAGRLEDAIRALEESLKNFPGEAALQTLLGQCREEFRKRAQAADVAKRLAEARSAAKNEDFDQAIRTVEAGLAAYPEEPALRQELDVLRTAKAAWQRRVDLAEVVRQTDQLGAEKRFDDAAKVLTAARAKHGDDVALREARKKIDKLVQDEKRRAAVAKAAKDAEAMIDGGRLDEALQFLSDACSRYPQELELYRLLSRARMEVEVRQRDEAIAQVRAKVAYLVAQKYYARAFEALNEGLAKWPQESSLLLLQEQVTADKASSERSQAILELKRNATQMWRAGSLDQALQAIDQGLVKYPEATALSELKQQVLLAREQKLRAEAVAAEHARATALVRADRLDEAAQALKDSLGRYPGESSLESLLAQTQQEIQNRQELARSAAAAEALLNGNRVDEAIQLLERAMGRFPGNAVLAGVMTRAQAERAKLQQAAAIAKIAAKCKALADARDFDAALTQLDASLKKWPRETSLADLKRSVSAAKAAWQREQALNQTLQLMERLDRENRIEQGLEQSEAALRDFPESAVLQAFRARFRSRKDLRDATALIDQGRAADALQFLEKLAKAGAAETEPLVVRAKELLAAQERTAAIEALRAEVQRKIDVQDLDGALVLLDEGLRRWPGEASLLAIRETATRAKENVRREESVRDNLRLCETLELENRFSEALQLMEQTLVEYQGGPKTTDTREALLKRTLQRLQAKKAEEERLAERLKDTEELGRLGREARQSSSPEQALAFLDAARKIAERYPDDATMRAAGVELLQQREAIVLAQKELASRDFAGALDTCTKALLKFPGHVILGQLQADALLIRLIVEKALAREKAEQWDEALAQWNSLAEFYPGYPGLDANIERVKNQRAQLSAAAVARWLERIQAEIGKGDLTSAGDLLGRALTEIPDATQLQAMRGQLEQAQKAKARVRDLLARGQEQGDKGRFADALAALREAFALAAADAASRKLVLAALLKYAQSALPSDWRSAEAFVAAVRELDSTGTIPERLATGIADRKKDEFVKQCIARVEQLRSGGDPRAALAELDRGLESYPAEPSLKRQRKALAGELKLLEFREGVKRELRQLREAGQAAADPAAWPPMIAQARGLAQQYRSDGELLGAAEETVRYLEGRLKEVEQRRRAAQQAAEEAAQRAVQQAAQRKRIAVIAAGVLGVAVLGFGARLLFGPGSSATLAVTTSPAGASVKAGEEVCNSPQCEFKLKYGTYPVEARLDGYRPAVETVILDAAHHDPLRIVLTPLLAQVQISTNLTSGSISLDGKPAGVLSSGQLTLTDVAFGKHELKISSQDGQAGVQFETAPGKLPSVLGKVDGHNADTVVVSNLGREVSLHCNCADGSVTLDGKPVGSIASGQLDLHDLSEGNKELKLGDRKLVVTVQPQPNVSIFVTSDRNIGTLVIETNVSDPTVLINNRKYPAQVTQGLIRIPLDVASYSVKLQKGGYKALEAKTVQIEKGGTQRLPFNLEPMNAAMQIRGADPGIQVAIDGKPAGQVQSDHQLLAEAPTGQHTIDLSKAGYVSKHLTRNFEPGRTVTIDSSDVLLNPDESTLAETRRKEEQTAWDAVNKNDRNALQQFADQHPNGRFATDARNQIQKLDADRRADQQKQTAKAEETAWAAVDQTKKASLQDFVNRYPNSSHAQPARDLMTGIDRQDAEAAQHSKEQLEKQQDSVRRAADEQAILRKVADYEAAFNRKDLAALESIWQGTPPKVAAGFESLFKDKDVKTLEFALTPVGQPVIIKDTATVNCTRVLKLTYPGRPVKPTSEHWSVTLNRTPAGWVIVFMTPVVRTPF